MKGLIFQVKGKKSKDIKIVVSALTNTFTNDKLFIKRKPGHGGKQPKSLSLMTFSSFNSNRGDGDVLLQKLKNSTLSFF